MTISPLLIYLIDVCDSLCIFFIVAFIILSIATYFFIWLMCDRWEPEDFKESLKSGVLKYFLIAIAVSILGCIFVPSKKTLIQMLVVPPIVNNEQIQELPANVLNFVNDYLKGVGKKEKDL